MRLGLLTLAGAVVLSGCAEEATQYSSYEPEPYVEVAAPEWSADSTIYQMNTRQFTAEGTFKAAKEQLPRLAEMGVEIIWLMPIHPIGEEQRKGSMGSPYAVKDYRAVNPDLGTEDEFRAFVDAAHELGLKVILDWVANHSAWDNPHVDTHPEWYTKTPEGDMMPPEGTDWSDVVDFDYSKAGLREYMTGSLTYWVREFDVDGYRADVAGYVPLDFWETARAELEAIKPVFMLAEWQTRDLHARAFNATYAWGWKEAMQKLVAEGSGAGAMRGYYAGQKTTWPHAAYRMVYTDNHDQNSWDGVASEIYGPAYETAIALS
ncbi:MAG: alpha-amylase family glycosyl hydrolase, partial [Pseudomonadota bacterium]